MSLETFLVDAIRTVVREELKPLFSELQRSSSGDRRVTRTEAAASAGVSPATVSNWVKGGKLRQYGKGRGVRFSLSEVLAVKPDVDTYDPEAKAEEILRRKQ